MDDITIKFADLPTTIRAFVRAESDGSYTILINSRMSFDMQRKAYLHEYNHIINGDYEKKCSADIIEYFAHI